MKGKWVMIDFFIDETINIKVEVFDQNDAKTNLSDIFVHFNDKLATRYNHEISPSNEFNEHLISIKKLIIEEIDRNFILDVPATSIARKINELLEHFEYLDKKFFTKEITFNGKLEKLTWFKTGIFIYGNKVVDMDLALHNAFISFQSLIHDFYIEFKEKYKNVLQNLQTEQAKETSFKLINPGKNIRNISLLYVNLKKHKLIDDTTKENSFIQVFRDQSMNNKITWIGTHKELKLLINLLVDNDIIYSSNKWQKTVYCFKYKDIKDKIIKPLLVTQLQHTSNPQNKTHIEQIIKDSFFKEI